MNPTGFYVLTTKFAGSLEPVAHKISFDKVNFFDFPPNRQAIQSHHPLVFKNSKYKSFLNELEKEKAKEKADEYLKKECYRNIRFEITKNQEKTEEAKFYLNNQDQFIHQGYILEPEQVYKADCSSMQLDRTSYSGSKLMAAFREYPN